MGLLVISLPGPDRKRRPKLYWYTLTYRNPDPAVPGCVSVWEVLGGRLPYQLALERDDAGTLRLHCTCADAVFRGEAEGRLCKHARGLLDFLSPVVPGIAPSRPLARLGA